MCISCQLLLIVDQKSWRILYSVESGHRDVFFGGCFAIMSNVATSALTVQHDFDRFSLALVQLQVVAISTMISPCQ